MDMGDLNFKIKPTDDYVFKRLFGDENNKDILISFLNALFDEYDFLPCQMWWRVLFIPFAEKNCHSLQQMQND